MKAILQDITILVGTSILVTLLVWLPHLATFKNFYGLDFSKGFATIYQNFDGLEYVIISKTNYSPLELVKIPQNIPARYFPSHFPGYSYLIGLLAPFTGYLKSMLLVTQISTILSAIVFYFLLKDFRLTRDPLWLSILFLLLPARWLIVHSVGAPEATFTLFTLLAIYFFLKFEGSDLKQRYIWIASIFGALAQITRPPGILLFVALVFYFHWKVIRKWQAAGFRAALNLHLKYSPLILIPLSLLLIFYLFQLQLNDFFAYFHSGDNIHLMFPPFQVFNKQQFWVGDIWLEDIIYIYIFGFLAAFRFLKTELKVLSFYILVFMVAGISIAHRDISRYLLPIAPLILISFEKVLVSKEFKWVMIILVLGIYLYAQNFILNNTAPINNLFDFN